MIRKNNRGVWFSLAKKDLVERSKICVNAFARTIDLKVARALIIGVKDARRPGGSARTSFHVRKKASEDYVPLNESS